MTHPFSLLSHFRLSAVLILLSVVQQLLFNPRGWLEQVSSLGFSFLFVIAAVAYSVSLYRSERYRLLQDRVHIRKGIFIKRSYTVLFDRIQTVAFNYDLIASLFGAVKVSIDTPAGSSRHCDASAYLSRANSELIKNKLLSGRKRTFHYRSGAANILFASLFWSNPVSGVLFIVPIITQLGKVIGRERTDLLLKGSLSTGSEFLAQYISPAAAAFAVILMLCWALSVVVQYQRYMKFSTSAVGDFISIRRGFVNPTTVFTRKTGIITAEENRSLLMNILGLYSAGVTVVGSGKLKGDKGIIIPPMRKKELSRTLNNLLGISDNNYTKLRPEKFTIYSYIYYPLIWLAADILAIILILSFRSFLTDVYLLTAVIAGIIILWWIAFRIFSYKNAFLAADDNRLILCTYKMLTLKKYYIPKEKISRIELHQSWNQKKRGTCSVRVWLYYEKGLEYTIKQLDKDKAEKLLKTIKD